MPRIVEFNALLDDVPSGSKYLCTINKRLTIDVNLSEDQLREAMVKKVVHGDENLKIGKEEIDVQIYVYEVSEDSFIRLVQSGFFTRSTIDKLNAFRRSIDLDEIK